MERIRALETTTGQHAHWASTHAHWASTHAHWASTHALCERSSAALAQLGAKVDDGMIDFIHLAVLIYQ